MKVAIIGAAGTIGRAAARELSARGHRVRGVGRQPDRLRDALPEGAEIVAADVSSKEGCARACAAADAVLYAIGLPYTRRAFAAYGPMMRLAVEAAREAGVSKVVLVTNVYPYGRPKTERVAETHPREPASVKGRYRKEQEDTLLAAHEPGALRTLSLRLPDFYGPFADLSLGNRIFESAVAGTRASLLGPIDTPHEFVFTPDVGRLVSDLLPRDDLFGEAYNFGGPGVVSMRQFARKVYEAAGTPLRIAALPPMGQRLLGLFMPMMRELAEMSYLQTDPIILDDSKLQRALGQVHKTPYEEGIVATLAHVGQR